MLFIDNKYTRWYNSIVSNASNRVLHPQIYTEKHHVIPKSLGGSNSARNLVRLTAREHFICHVLLTKMTTGKDRYRMLQAAEAFVTWTTHAHDRQVKINSKIFENLKLSKSQALKDLWANDNQYREKALTGIKGIMDDPDHKNFMSSVHKKLWADPEYVEKMKKRKSATTPIIVDGTLYKSMIEAAEKFNITKNAVCKRCRSDSPRFVNWKYVDHSS